MGIRKFFVAAVACLAAAGWAERAHAIVDLPVPGDAYINVDGLDWAWAAPCAAVEPSCGVISLAFQASQGWRLPTPEEFAVHPLAPAFIFPGGNVPLGGSDAVNNQFQDGPPPGAGACAAAYFSTVHTHCDWGNGLDGLWFDPAGGSDSYFETLVVRGEFSGPVSGIPEPATWAMMLLGFFGLGAALRGVRRRQALAA